MISPITQSFNKDAKDSANNTHNDTSSTIWHQQGYSFSHNFTVGSIMEEN